jgi:hypothetical protein
MQGRAGLLFWLDVDELQAKHLQDHGQPSGRNAATSDQRTSAFKYLLHTGAVSLAAHRAHTAEPNLLGHVDCPDARAAAHVEDTGLPVLRNRRLVQAVAPCDCEHFVVDVHAVLLGLRASANLGGPGGAAAAHLVARVHVDASPEAMIPAAVFHVVAVLSRHGQTAGAR